MDVEIFESGKKKFRIQKYPDTCGRLLRRIALSSDPFFNFFVIIIHLNISPAFL